MNVRLNGKKALVGGSTQGIGKAIALAFAAAGAQVTLLARNEEKLRKVLQDLEGEGHDFLVADFSDFNSLERHKEQISTAKYQILVNNAGGPAPGPAHTAGWEDFEKALTAHLKTSHQLVQWVIPAMRAAGYGRIVNIISTSVKIPIPGLGVSNTTRGAVASWSKTLAYELGKDGITVNNILPGTVNTQRLKSIIDGEATTAGVSPKEIAEKMKSTVPARRFGEPEELAYLATFLCSELAGYINGTNIPVDGGRTGSL